MAGTVGASVVFPALCSPMAATLGRGQRGIGAVDYFLGIYAPYTHFKAKFATENLERLWESLDEDDKRDFPFDVTTIDWRHYLQEVHIPGLKRHILRMAEDDGAADSIQTLPDLLAHAAARFPKRWRCKGRDRGQGARSRSGFVTPMANCIG
jgi:hypothetical protein